LKKLIGLILILVAVGIGADDFKNSHWTFTAEWNRYTIKERRVGNLPKGTIDFEEKWCIIKNPKSETHSFYIDGEFLFIGDFTFTVKYKGEDTVILDPIGHGDNPLDYNIIMKRK